MCKAKTITVFFIILEEFQLKTINVRLKIKRQFFLMSLTKRSVKVKWDHRSKFSNLSNWKEEA